MRLSAHLKGKDYRDLLEIIDLTYSASSIDALLPPLFEKLAKAIGCNNAFYLPASSGRPKAKYGAVLFEMDPQLAREYAEYYCALDPFCFTGFIKNSNRAARVSDLVRWSRFADSEFVIDFLARVPCYWGLAGFVGGPGRSVGGIALLRLRQEQDFSERDLAFVRALLPHLSRALSFFELQNQRPRATGILILDNVGTVVYSNEAATHILKGKPAEAVPLPIGQSPLSQGSPIFQSALGDYAVGMQTIPGPYKVVSLEPTARHNTLRSRLADLGLTARQQEIASRALHGVSNKQIASELDLAEQTVKDHLHAIFRKLGIHHRAELASRFLPISLDELR